MFWKKIFGQQKNSTSKVLPHGSLSARGMKLSQNPARIDLDIFMEASRNLYHPGDNPRGAFPLNVAENCVTNHLIGKKMSEILASGQPPEWTLKYTSPAGHPTVREIMADFLRTHFHSPSIAADNILFSAGASATLEVMSFVLANPGDIVVIPAPSYPMYTNDLGIKSGMERFDLQSNKYDDHGSMPSHVDVSMLEKTKKTLDQQGKTFRILLITTPDNPTGCVYTRDQLESIAEWCMAHKIHLVVNEIYALSMLDTTNPLIAGDYTSPFEFHSFAQLMAKHQSDYLHHIYALSKDFAMSGFRFGVSHTLNNDMFRAMQNVNIPHMVSNLTQWAVGELFSDTLFIENYIRVNQANITKSYTTVIKTLRALDIPYFPAHGSLFVWANFSRFVSGDAQDAEMEFWMALYNKTGILLTPGVGFGHRKKGFFRIVHTAIPTEYLEVAMVRLKDYLGQNNST